MIDGKKVLAVIPARGGSKGLPNKNIKELCGKPLIVWTIEKAKLSKYIDELIVSTDSQTIANIAKDAGCNVPFLRPESLSEDTTPMYEVVLHSLNYFSNNKIHFDIIALLEPTSPLREDDDIDKMIEKLNDCYDKFDTIVSLGEVTEHPSIMKKIVDQKLYPFCEKLDMALRRQDNEPAYFPYGVAYISKTKSFIEEKTFYQKRTTYYKIKRYQNYEVDSIYDFLAIENIIKYEWGIK